MGKARFKNREDYGCETGWNPIQRGKEGKVIGLACTTRTNPNKPYANAALEYHLKCFYKQATRFVGCYSTILIAKINIHVAKNRKCTMQTDESQAYIFRPYITVKGKRITRPNGGMFKIPVKRDPKK